MFGFDRRSIKINGREVVEIQDGDKCHVFIDGLKVDMGYWAAVQFLTELAQKQKEARARVAK